MRSWLLAMTIPVAVVALMSGLEPDSVLAQRTKENRWRGQIANKGEIETPD